MVDPGPKLPYSFRPLDFGVPAYVEIFVMFDSEDEIKSFNAAALELRALDGTQAFLADWKESMQYHKAGHTDPAPGTPYLVGRVIGPQRHDLPDGNLPSNKTQWAADVYAILEAHGLSVEDQTEEMAS